jgi:hypothetical protein
MIRAISHTRRAASWRPTSPSLYKGWDYKHHPNLLRSIRVYRELPRRGQKGGLQTPTLKLPDRHTLIFLSLLLLLLLLLLQFLSHVWLQGHGDCHTHEKGRRLQEQPVGLKGCCSPAVVAIKKQDTGDAVILSARKHLRGREATHTYIEHTARPHIYGAHRASVELT